MAAQLKVSSSSYQLKPLGWPHRPPRQGALLRVEHADGAAGYADCHPWPELGDEPVERQLALLARGKLTPLTERSLHFAGIDARARIEGRALFSGLTLPKCQWTVPHLETLTGELIGSLAARGFETVKVKCGSDYRKTLARMEELFASAQGFPFRLRFDFNEMLEGNQFEDLLDRVSGWKDTVDFFEDPTPYDPAAWQEWRERYGVRLACDRHALASLRFPSSCDYLVVKPAVEPVEPFLTPMRSGRPLVITSYLDHPIGLLGAGYAAAKAYSAHPEAFSQCGLLTQHCYLATPFCEGMRELTPYLTVNNGGTGWGYDNILPSLPWEPLA